MPVKKSVKAKKPVNGTHTAKHMKATNVSASSDSASSKSASGNRTKGKQSAEAMNIEVASTKKGSKRSEPIEHASVQYRAWEIWQREGCPNGRDLEHWLQAEQELRSGK